MARKLLLINLVLTLAVAGLGMHLIWSWQEFEQQQSIPRLLAELGSPQNSQVQPLSQDYGQQPGYVDYQLISEKNLFSDDRQPPQENADEVAEETAPVLNPEPILHGTLVIGDRQFATITKFEGTRRRTQQSKVRVSLGDDVQGYKVSEITRDAIVLKWNDTEVVIEKEVGERPEAPARNQIARGGGINIVRIGAPVTAVETTSPTASDEQQETGLTVSRTGLAQAQSGGVAERARGQSQAGANSRGGAANRARGNQTQNPESLRQGQPTAGGVVPNGSTNRPVRRPPR